MAVGHLHHLVCHPGDSQIVRNNYDEVIVVMRQMPEQLKYLFPIRYVQIPSWHIPEDDLFVGSERLCARHASLAMTKQCYNYLRELYSQKEFDVQETKRIHADSVR